MVITTSLIIEFIILFGFAIFFSRQVDVAFPILSQEQRGIIWWVLFLLVVISRNN